jgi:hypothetical protein
MVVNNETHEQASAPSAATNATATRSTLLRRGGLIAGGAALLAMVQPISFPQAFAQTAGCPESTTDILNAALTAEQLATTFYYQALVGGPPRLQVVHDEEKRPYFQAALWEEFQHAALFSSVGAKSLAGPSPRFYFPAPTFSSSTQFLRVLDALETAFISAYIAAIGAWAGASPNAVSSTGSFTPAQLAKIAAQILGIEAEHRVLGRDAGGEEVPNNLILERALFSCVGSATNTSGTAVGALLPFVTGGPGFAGPYTMPSEEQVRSAVGSVIIAKVINPGLASP